MYKNSNLIKKYLIKYEKNFERGDALYCLVCNQNVVIATTVSRHVRSNRHITGFEVYSEAISGTSFAVSWK